MDERISKIEESIKNLKEKNSRIYFFVQDTKGNARASVRYIYQMALTLKDLGYNSIMLHEKSDYHGVSNWLSSKFMELPHKSVEGQNLEISPEDMIIVPEIFGYIMAQISNLPCAKIVLSQAYDHVFETLQPGQSWSQLGFAKCITTSEKQKEYLSSVMRGVSYDIVEPYISNVFETSQYPAKPIITIHSREQRDSINIIKSFYQKYPQFRWISFRDMRAMSEEEFATHLKESMLSVWIDPTSSFGTFPLESIKVGVPVIGKVPNLVPEWMTEKNGVWVQDSIRMIDYIADFVQNWLEDNISEDLYTSMSETAEKYSNEENFKNKVSELFSSYTNVRISNFESELNKLTSNVE
jgi:hypothetical protein